MVLDMIGMIIACCATNDVVIIIWETI